MSHTQELPVRVLQIVTNMSYGGLENLLMNYYRHIDRSKVQFDFLTHVSIHQDFEEEIEALGGRVYRLPRLNPFSLRYRRCLHAFFDEHPEYKAVHCHLDCMAGLPLKIAQEHGVPFRIAHSHGSNQNHNLKYLIKLIYKRSIPRYATQLFACGKEAGDWMFDGKPYTIMSNAIDVREFSYDPTVSAEVRNLLGTEASFTVGHVGQFRREKNHLFLIEVFERILKKEPRCKLLLVGKGPQMDAAKARAKELHIDDAVLFLGARPDIARLMQAMDVFVLPSLYEGLPVTMIEAQSAGLPCVVSDGVPMECKLTDAVVQVSLASGAQAWADAILAYRGHMRSDTGDALRQAGFDICSNAAWLEEFYEQAYT